MTPNEYQTQAARTLIDAPPQPLTSADHMIVWNAVGLAGEAGEVLSIVPTGNRQAEWLAIFAMHICEHVKKGIFHEQGLSRFTLQEYLAEVVSAAAGLWQTTSTVQATDRPAPKAELCKELGDVLWYVAALCSKLDVPMGSVCTAEEGRILSYVMRTNIKKLAARFPAGWSTVDAAAKADEAPE